MNSYIKDLLKYKVLNKILAIAKHKESKDVNFLEFHFNYLSFNT